MTIFFYKKIKNFFLIIYWINLNISFFRKIYDIIKFIKQYLINLNYYNYGEEDVKIKSITVDTFGANYGLPKTLEAFDYNEWFTKNYGGLTPQ